MHPKNYERAQELFSLRVAKADQKRRVNQATHLYSEARSIVEMSRETREQVKNLVQKRLDIEIAKIDAELATL